MNVDDVFNAGKSLKAPDLKGRSCVLVMGNSSLVEFKDGNKIELELQGTDRTLILNKTNTTIIKSIYGPNTENWFGRQIEIYPDKTMYGSDMVDCIRVRAPQGQQTQQQAGMAAQDPMSEPVPVNPNIPGAAPTGAATPGPILDDKIPFSPLRDLP